MGGFQEFIFFAYRTLRADKYMVLLTRSFSTPHTHLYTPAPAQLVPLGLKQVPAVVVSVFVITKASLLSLRTTYLQPLQLYKGTNKASNKNLLTDTPIYISKLL